MDAQRFLSDLEAKPDVLGQLADRLDRDDLWATVPASTRRLVFLGMGSSRSAGSVAAARLRSRGLDAVAELASSDLLPPPSAGTVVVAVSASGGSRETADAVVPMFAGEPTGCPACPSCSSGRTVRT